MEMGDICIYICIYVYVYICIYIQSVRFHFSGAGITKCGRS